MYLYTCVSVHAHMHISAHTVNPTQPSCTCYMYIYIYIYIYIHACIRMDTQTHTCTPCKPNIAFLYLLRSCESCIVLVIVSCSALHQYQLCQKRPTNMEKRPRHTKRDLEKRTTLRCQVASSRSHSLVLRCTELQLCQKRFMNLQKDLHLKRRPRHTKRDI